jgi:hypothetical protein
LVPLLQRPRARQLVLVEPAVALHIGDGRDNWSDLRRLEPPESLDESERGREAPAADGADFSIAGLSIEDGRLELPRRATARNLSSSISTSRQALTQDSPTAIRAGFALKQGTL